MRESEEKRRREEKPLGQEEREAVRAQEAHDEEKRAQEARVEQRRTQDEREREK